jgi:hypothetical protein
MRSVLAQFSVERLVLVCAAVALLLGLQIPTARYLSPQSGFGYALGIIGGSMMLILLLYPLRKRVRALRFLGTLPQVFRVHMILGIVGPICILYHCAFSFGATNSNVALVSMLVVSTSGIVGRYFYSKIHHGLYGRKAGLAELQQSAQVLKEQNPSLPMMPELIGRIETEEKRLLAVRGPMSVMFIAPFLIPIRMAAARHRLRSYVRTALRQAAAEMPTIATEQRRVKRVVRSYIDRRLGASRRVMEFRTYERLFSMWHILHLPLFFMLLAAGIVHVIAVNVY